MSDSSQLTETERLSRDLDWLYNRMRQTELEVATLRFKVATLEKYGLPSNTVTLDGAELRLTTGEANHR